MLPHLSLRTSLVESQTACNRRGRQCPGHCAVFCDLRHEPRRRRLGYARHCTVRNLFFLASFAAPGLRKWLPWYPQPAPLIQAFVAAQMVHFGAVIALHTKFAAEPLHLGPPQIAVVLLGFSLILATGLTATPRPQSRVYSLAHVVFPYVIWLILAADYPGHPVKPVRLIAIPVLFALVLMHLPRRRAFGNEAVAS
jgi:hypothetical protein